MSPDKADLLAFDLGAESGRAILGHFRDDLLKLEEIYRFPNNPVQVQGSLHWDVLQLWSEIQQGLKLAAQSCGSDLRGVGVDTWGVDFGLLAEDDTLIGNPYHYRDSRTDGMVEWAFQRLPRQEIYQVTGIQFMQLNSLFQLLAMVKSRAPALRIARHFLTMPDLFNFWLTGRKANEFSIATTTQCLTPIWEIGPGRCSGSWISPRIFLARSYSPAPSSASCARRLQKNAAALKFPCWLPPRTIPVQQSQLCLPGLPIISFSARAPGL